MRTIAALGFLVLVASAARAQGRAEGVTFGVTAGAGIPAAMGAVRIGSPLGPHAGIDAGVARLTNVAGWHVGPAYFAHVRWLRGGRDASGGGRYWIVGALGMRGTSSTSYGTTTKILGHIVKHETIIMPRLGYGWDQVTRRGGRFGVELTGGSAEEDVPLVLANVFVMWGPPRR
jgi:hypothetical protein